jgi:hypothetical protein
MGSTTEPRRASGDTKPAGAFRAQRMKQKDKRGETITAPAFVAPAGAFTSYVVPIPGRPRRPKPSGPKYRNLVARGARKPR